LHHSHSYSHQGLCFWNWWLGSIGQLLQQSMWCSNSSHILFLFLPPPPPHFFQHRLHFTSASSLMRILSYFHSHFSPLDVLENEYTSCHSTLIYTKDTVSQPDVHSSTEPMQWFFFPLTVAAPLTWLLLP
jgi:hypothetical protein